MKCEKCGCEHDGSYGSGRFCNIRCANSIGGISVNGTKIVPCKMCGKDVKVTKRGRGFSYCEQCKKIKVIKKCKICGESHNRKPMACKHHLLLPTLIKYFGLDETKIGTIDIIEEFERIRNKVIEQYCNEEKTLEDLQVIYNHPNIRNFSKILNSLEIKRRSLHEAGIASIKNGRQVTRHNYKHKHGWHITWNNKKVFYRSSLELKYAKQLDEQQIDYEMESLRIIYWDSQKQIQRVAIPDFYLIKSNTIIEIKGDYYFDEQNINDKIKAYKQHGYNFKLIRN